MQKEKLIATAEEWKKESEKMHLMGYPRKNQAEIVKASNAIIRAMCEIDGLTPFIAKNALKMTEDIITLAIENEVIS